VTLAFLALAWLLGVAAAALTGAETAASVAAASLFAAVFFAARPRLSTLAICAFGAALIFVAAEHYQDTVPAQAPDSIARFNEGNDLRVRAVVSEEPEERETSNVYRLDVQQAFLGGQWQKRSGGVLMRSPPAAHHDYGDVLEVRGRLETPPTFEDFDYREFLLRRGVASIIAYPETRLIARNQGGGVRQALIGVRSDLSDRLAGVLPQREASLAAGILFGARSALPNDLRDDMNATGTSHLVAVSGQNVTLLAGLLIAAFAWLIGRRPACVLSLVGIAAYVALVGAQPSVLRAGMMGALYTLAVLTGRQSSAPIALLLAAAVMTGLDPQVVHDVSFQLSFAAVVGLIILAPLLNTWMELAVSRWPAVRGFPPTRMVIDTSAVSLAAIAFTMPIAAVNFHQVSLAAPLANLLAVPAFLAVAAAAAGAALASLVLPGHLVAWLAWPPAAYMIGVITLFARLPAASIQIHGIHLVHAVIWYAALLGVIYVAERRRVQIPEPAPALAKLRLSQLAPVGALGGLIVLATAVVWLAVSAPVQGRLTVSFLDVGQGDAILIRGPDGNRVLVDGGPSGPALTAALDRHLPFYDRRIDLIVLTHPQADHIGGLPAALSRYDVHAVLATQFDADSRLYEEWRRTVATSGAETTTANRGQRIELGDGAAITVLNPDPGLTLGNADGLNGTSVVLKLEMGRRSFLLTGDIGQEAEARLLAEGTDLRATVLKVAHHGSTTSTSKPFLERVSPSVDVISVGAANRFGHPSADVVDRLTGDKVYRTDQQGDVTISTDGEYLWVDTQR